MKNKGIAIKTILLILAGIIALVVVVYLLYTYMIGPTLPVQQCKTEMLQYCTLCANLDWSGMPTPQKLRDCGDDYPELSGWSDNYCCDDSSYNPGDPDAVPPIPPTGCGMTQTDCRALGGG